MRNRKRGALAFLLLLAMALCGCGKSAVFLSKIPDGYGYVEGLNNSGFLMKTDAPYQTVTSVNEMEDPDAYYCLKEDETVAYVLRPSFLVSECHLPAEDLSDVRPALERAAHIRLVAAEKIDEYTDPYRGMTKRLYRCSAEGLFTHLYYGDYSGYMAVIEKDADAYLLFAGTLDGSGKTLSIAQSLWYKEYPYLGNAGRQTAVPDAGRKEGTTGTEVDTDVRYTKDDRVETVTMGLTCLRTETFHAEDYEEELRSLPVKEVLEAPEGMEWRTAVFSTNFRGYDVSKKLPSIPIHVRQDGHTDRTYVLRTGEELHLFYLVKTNEPYEFVCGIGDDPAVIRIDG